jgi:Tfp pilus assembly protein PilO
MKGSDKAVVLGVVMAVVLGAFYFMVLSPKREKASSLGDEVTALKGQVAIQQQAAQFGEQARQEFPAFYGRLVVMGKAVPDQADSASLLVQLSALSRRTDVVFQGIEVGAGSTDADAAAAATTPPPADSSSGSTGTSSTGTTSTPAPSGSSGASPSATPAATTSPTPATEATAANMPIGAVVGPDGLGTMPYTLTFKGNYFQIANFLKGVDDLVHMHGNTEVAADGRLLTINGFSLSTPRPPSNSPLLKAVLAVTSYTAPATEGLTAGASPTAPSPSLTQPQTQPASATVSP